jgi:hypothetical protein
MAHFAQDGKSDLGVVEITVNSEEWTVDSGR